MFATYLGFAWLPRLLAMGAATSKERRFPGFGGIVDVESYFSVTTELHPCCGDQVDIRFKAFILWTDGCAKLLDACERYIDGTVSQPLWMMAVSRRYPLGPGNAPETPGMLPQVRNWRRDEKIRCHKMVHGLLEGLLSLEKASMVDIKCEGSLELEKVTFAKPERWRGSSYATENRHPWYLTSTNQWIFSEMKVLSVTIRSNVRDRLKEVDAWVRVLNSGPGRGSPEKLAIIEFYRSQYKPVLSDIASTAHQMWLMIQECIHHYKMLKSIKDVTKDAECLPRPQKSEPKSSPYYFIPQRFETMGSVVLGIYESFREKQPFVQTVRTAMAETIRSGCSVPHDEEERSRRERLLRDDIPLFPSMLASRRAPAPVPKSAPPEDPLEVVPESESEIPFLIELLFYPFEMIFDGVCWTGRAIYFTVEMFYNVVTTMYFVALFLSILGGEVEHRDGRWVPTQRNRNRR